MTCEECEHWKRRVKELEKKVAEQKEMIERLYSKLRQYENPHTPPSKKRDSSNEDEGGKDEDENENEDDGEGDTVKDDDTDPDQPDLTSDDRSTDKKPGRKEGHEGTTRPKPEVDEKLDVTEDECPHCSSSLDDPDEIETKTIEDLTDKASVEVIEYKIGHYFCDDCGEKVIANHPDCPDEGRFGNRTCTQTTLLKFEDRLTHRKVKNTLKRDHGLDVSTATVLDLTRRTADKLRPEYKEIQEDIINSDVLYTDETGMKVDGKQYWIWGFRNEDSIFFALRNSRGKKVLNEILGDEFDGTIVCDGWRSYPSFTSDLQRCWAHLLREAKDLDSDEGENLADQLQDMYDELTEFVDRKPPPSKRKRKKEEAKTAMKEMIDQEWDEERTDELATKIERGLDHWFTFVTEKGVVPTNNKAERALREHVVHRKIIGTLRNEKGTYIHETVMTMLATWKERSLNTHDEMLRILRS